MSIESSDHLYTTVDIGFFICDFEIVITGRIPSCVSPTSLEPSSP